MQVHPLTSDAERIDLLVRISRCRDLLAVLREAGARKTLEDMIVHMEAGLKAMDAPTHCQ
jgi:hypothetical protein